MSRWYSPSQYLGNKENIEFSVTWLPNWESNQSARRSLASSSKTFSPKHKRETRNIKLTLWRITNRLIIRNDSRPCRVLTVYIISEKDFLPTSAWLWTATSSAPLFIKPCSGVSAAVTAASNLSNICFLSGSVVSPSLTLKGWNRQKKKKRKWS